MKVVQWQGGLQQLQEGQRGLQQLQDLQEFLEGQGELQQLHGKHEQLQKEHQQLQELQDWDILGQEEVGRDGKGRDVIGWEWGLGEVRRVEKVGKIKRLVPTNHPQASLWRPFGFCGAACGTLGALVRGAFCDFGKVPGSSGAKARKRFQNK